MCSPVELLYYPESGLCYLLRWCGVGRTVARAECPVTPDTLLRLQLFTQSEERCRHQCVQEHACRYHILIYVYPLP